MDCQRPKKIIKYDLFSMCENEKKLDQQVEEYMIVQKKQHDTLKGHSCSITKSSFVMYCGAFSHFKLAQPPDIEISQRITVRECATIINTGKYRTIEGSVHYAKLGTETIFHVTERGVIHTEQNKITCQGEAIKVGNNIIESMMVINQYRVVLQEEEYVIQDGRVEATSVHIRLPKVCSVNKGGCQTNKQTFTWDTPEDECPLEKVRTIRLQRQGSWAIDYEEKMIFNITGQEPSPASCASTTLLKTEYDDIYLTKSTNFNQQVKEVKIDLYIRNRDNYLMWEIEQTSNHIMKHMTKGMCEERYHGNPADMIKVDGNLYGKRAGDTMYVFDCEEKLGKLATLKTCHQQIPIEGGQFVDPVTRIATASSAKVECNPFFATTVLTEEGWVTITPDIVATGTPSKMTIQNRVTQHEDLSHGGIYTKEEINSWESVIQWSSYHNALSQNLAYGVCIHDGKCDGGQVGFQTTPGYNLDRLMDEVGDFNLLTYIDKQINRFSTYISLCVLIIWVIRAMTWITMVTLTLARDGFQATVALMYTTCCATTHAASKVRRRVRRHRTTLKSELSADESEQIALDRTA